MTTTSSDLSPFTRAVGALLDREGTTRDRAIAAEISIVRGELRLLPSTGEELPVDEHPATRHLRQALDGWPSDADGLRSALLALGPKLPWRYSYPRRADAPDLSARVAFAELIGPAAPIHAERLCVGVTLVAPHTLYPDHHHPATELYRVLSGTAIWSAAGSERRVPPGEWVLHPSGVLHSMRTSGEPLLALYTWSGGDVTTPSVYG